MLAGCSGSGPAVKRTPFKGVEQPPEKILKKYSLKRFESKQANYAYSAPEGATFRGEILHLTGGEGKPSGKQFHLKPGLKGSYGMYLDVQLYVEGVIKFLILHGEKVIFEKEYSERGIFSIDPVRDMDLSERDRVTLEISGKGVVLLGEPVFYKKAAPAERDYVFIICADTLRADHLPVYGYNRDTAPNIDEFSRDAAVFENAFAHSPWTMPSHMSLFTALYEYNHGVKKDGTLDPSKPFLVEALSRKFATRGINGGGYLKGLFGFYRGFDYYRSYGRCGAKPDSAKWLFTLAREDLEQKSFPAVFYFLHSYQIHAPYQPPRKFLNYFNPTPLKRKMNTPHNLNLKTSSREEIDTARKNAVDLYDGEIRAFDHWFGEFTAYLKKKNIYDKAMIIFLSDHGEEFFEHKGWGHSHALYNEVTRVPLIVKFPGQRFKGRRVTHAVGLIDVMPTVLNYYRISEPGKDVEIDGRDLVPVIEGKQLNRALTSSITSGYYFNAQPFKIALIENLSKITLTVPQKKALSGSYKISPRGFEFYDLLKDPTETMNLYLRRMREIERFYPLFKSILRKARFVLKKEGNKAEIDQQTRDALKSLGYL